ncbi:hypothetical protein RHGRI_029152 [Rhododendron griersonianum]|uniref:Uncharacterized protein n=1 Tax=Rhododendron griersonianum TaxID=479676 RepID=A0AAV6II86_9ERIC|nr:hypothetical protein RHGRI_029152 [Rhododendron griersonianum]
MNEAKRSAKAVRCKNTSVGERSALEGSIRTSSGGRSGSENVGLSNVNIGENPMPRKPKGSFATSGTLSTLHRDRTQKHKQMHTEPPRFKQLRALAMPLDNATVCLDKSMELSG